MPTLVRIQEHPYAAIALAVERTLGKGKGVGSNPTGGFGTRLADSQEGGQRGVACGLAT